MHKRIGEVLAYLIIIGLIGSLFFSVFSLSIHIQKEYLGIYRIEERLERLEK